MYLQYHHGRIDEWMITNVTIYISNKNAVNEIDKTGEIYITYYLKMLYTARG